MSNMASKSLESETFEDLGVSTDPTWSMEWSAILSLIVVSSPASTLLTVLPEVSWSMSA